MKKVIQLTESDLVSLVSRVLQEQSQSNKIQKGTLLTVVKKTDKSSNPKEEMALVKVVYDDGQGGKRAEIKISGQSDVQQPIDLKKMEFGDYKIIKINGKPINQTAKPVVSKEKKNTPKLPFDIKKQLRQSKDLTDFVLYRFDLAYSEANEGTPVGIKILKDGIQVENYPSGRDSIQLRRIKAKTSDGKNIVLDYRCGREYVTISGGPFQIGLKVANRNLIRMLEENYSCPQG